jgi:hypothetical protein
MDSIKYSDSHNPCDADDYVFINEEEYFLREDEEEWEDAERIVLRDSDWPEVCEDDDSIDLSQSPSCATVGSLVEDDDDIIDEKEMGTHHDLKKAFEANFQEQTESAVIQKELYSANPKEVSATALISSTRATVDSLVPTKANTSRKCNKKRRKKMKEQRKSMAKAEAIASLPRNVSTATKVTTRSEDRTRYLNNVCAPLTNMGTNTASKIALMCATEAMSSYRFTRNFKTKSEKARSKYAILLG